MADRTFHLPEGSLENRMVELYAEITFGAAGAVSASSGKGVASVTRDAQGEYTVALTDRYPSFLAASYDYETTETNAGWVCTQSEAVDTATPSVTFRTNDAAGAKVDPADGEKLRVCFKLKNSSI
jgi:hypothetical protein